jgi:hypothetical protein
MLVSKFPKCKIFPSKLREIGGFWGKMLNIGFSKPNFESQFPTLVLKIQTENFTYA